MSVTRHNYVSSSFKGTLKHPVIRVVMKETNRLAGFHDGSSTADQSQGSDGFFLAYTELVSQLAGKLRQNRY